MHLINKYSAVVPLLLAVQELDDQHACVQAGKLELKKRLEGQLSKWASLLQKFLRSTDDQVLRRDATFEYRPSQDGF